MKSLDTKVAIYAEPGARGDLVGRATMFGYEIVENTKSADLVLVRVPKGSTILRPETLPEGWAEIIAWACLKANTHRPKDHGGRYPEARLMTLEEITGPVGTLHLETTLPREFRFLSCGVLVHNGDPLYNVSPSASRLWRAVPAGG